MRDNIHTNSISVIIKTLLVLMICAPLSLFSQNKVDSPSTKTPTILIEENDSVMVSDTLINDTLKMTPVISKDGLKSKLTYSATDSIRFDMQNNLVFLYGKAEVYYEDIELKAEEIKINMDSNTVFARGKKDSLGNYYGEPVMKQGSRTFNAHEIGYNIDTKKGIITEVMTNEGEGYIHGETVYKSPNNTMYIKHGKYTTCNLPHPHYFFKASKLKVIPKDKIITGPANLHIEDIPTPIAIPFGFFPNSNKQKSGLIIPTPGESTQYGFFLLGGGYYLGISDNLNAQLTGDFYSKGSWATSFLTNYKKRYGYSGNFNARFSTFKDGIRDFNGFSERKDFFLRWNHRQDPKARPNSVFTADVNFGTSENFTNNFNSSSSDFLSASFNSMISYKKSWTGKPYNFSINAFHSQNSATKIVTVRLPEVTFNVSRLYPFKKRIAIGKQRFYEKIGISYTLNSKNEVTAQDSLFSVNRFDQLREEFRTGVRHNIPISTSFKVLKNFTVNPAINLTEIWYLKSIDRKFEDDTLRENTVNGFVRGGTYSSSIDVSTKIYGTYQYRGKVIKALRHVITPSIGLSYTPENNSGLSSYIDTTGTRIEYSTFQGNIYGTTNTREAGLINFGLLNNFELKVRNRKDSLGADKKIKLLENLRFASSYNIAADSLNWSNITIGARTNIFKKVSLNFNGVIDPYVLDSNGRKINSFEINNNNRLGRLTSANLAVSFALKSKQNNNKKEKDSEFGTEEELQYIRSNPGDFIDFNVPWSINFNYNIRYSKPQFESSVIQTLNFSGDFSLTPKWKVGFTSGYDFEQKDLSYTTIDIYRDLHCWEMSFNWVPFGVRQSYLFTIKVKSAILQDLKLTRRSLPNVF